MWLGKREGPGRQDRLIVKSSDFGEEEFRSDGESFAEVKKRRAAAGRPERFVQEYFRTADRAADVDEVLGRRGPANED